MEKVKILSIRDFRIIFDTLDKRQIFALNGVNLDAYAGETLAIVGESGSGKTQLSLGIMSLLSKNARAEGEILFGDSNLLKVSESEINKVRGNKISMIFQDPMTALNPYLKIVDQMTEVLTLKQGVDEKTALERSIEMLRLVSIPEPEKRIYQYPHQFSGGMKQRVMIAMAILSNPLLLIADEPTTALDVTIQAQILEIFQKLKEELKLGIILITHDLGVVANVADKIAVMYAGRVVEYGTKDEVFNDPKHPYTVALLNSIPRLEQKKDEKLYLIEGIPPVMFEKPSQCMFSNRCKFSFSKCTEHLPIDTKVTETHLYACHLGDTDGK